MRGRKTETSDGVSPGPGRDDASEHEFRQALKRLGLAVGVDDFDLALSGYSRVMREIGTVRQYLAAERSGASKPGGADSGEALA